MNIVHLQLGGNPGGIVILTRDMSLLSEHNNCFYFLFEGGSIADEIANSSPVYVEGARHKAFFSAPKSFLRYCKEQKADVIILHTPAPLGIACALYAKRRMKNCKLFVYWHSNMEEPATRDLKYRLEIALEKAAYRRCDKALAISESVKKSHIKFLNIKNDKIVVNYNGIFCNKFYTEVEAGPHLPFSIIYIGRIYYSKGIHVLLDALSKLPDEVKNKIHVTLVGNDSGGYTEKMKQKAEKLELDGIVDFTGIRLDVPELLAKADLFVHPAICEEGFGITLAEAMAAYLPCLAFNKGAIPEIIDNGINGFIADKATSKCLAEYIEKAYRLFSDNNPEYMTLRNNARNKAKCFSIEQSVKTLEELY
ncbi:MAG: glycosyltransferase family 4 protein [Eubacterium sp.]|nr:glycosyltransferase family 4 protein [Eubacterium sp.]